MVKESTKIKIKVLDREIQVACSEDEQEALLNAASFVGSEMQSVKAKGGNPSTEKIAIITAMNLANELLQLRKNTATLERTSSQLGVLQEKIANVLK